MRFAFIDVERALYPLWLLCRVLGVSRSGYCLPIVRSRMNGCAPRSWRRSRSAAVRTAARVCLANSSTRASRLGAGVSLV